MPQFNFHTTGPEVVQAFSEQIKGKTFLITGPSPTSLGAQTALQLAAASPGAFILLGRSAQKTQPVIDSLKSISPNTAVHFIQVELSDFASVRRAAEAVKALGTKIDTLLNNAGIMALHEYTTNGDGIEMQFATNHLGPFLLTNLLLPSLAPGGRVVNVSSAGHALGDVRFTDWNFQDGRAYDEWAAYGQGKCANVLFARALAGKGVKAWSLHPGNIHGTGLAKDLVNPDWELVARMFESVGRPMPGLKTVEEGCATIVLACVGEGLVDGGYLNDCRVEESTAFSSDLGNAERLWELSERLVGAKFDV